MWSHLDGGAVRLWQAAEEASEEGEEGEEGERERGQSEEK